jgi:hypothetical protein
MSADNPDTERRPRPEGETRVVMERSVGQTLLQAAEAIADNAQQTVVTLAVADAYAKAKAKGKLGSKGNDSNSSSDSKD